MNFDSIRSQAMDAMTAFWEDQPSPAKPARRKRVTKKTQRKVTAKPATKTVSAKATKPVKSPFGDMSSLIDSAMGGA